WRASILRGEWPRYGPPNPNVRRRPGTVVARLYFAGRVAPIWPTNPQRSSRGEGPDMAPEPHRSSTVREWTALRAGMLPRAAGADNTGVVSSSRRTSRRTEARNEGVLDHARSGRDRRRAS